MKGNDAIDEIIVSSLTRQWATPKQLEVTTGIPWRVLMRACQRLQLWGKIEGRLDYVVALRSRKKPQRRYRSLPAVELGVYTLLVGAVVEEKQIRLGPRF